MTELLLLDTSAAIPLLQHDHPAHERVAARVAGGRRGLAGHAAFETYSVLTRMPPPRRIPPRLAERLLGENFPDTRHPSARSHALLLSRLADHVIAGGSVFDALVSLAAAEHDAVLVSRDRRAADVYRAMGARVEFV